jgi:ADP-heptose:LPS heptosyltransferase
MEGISRSLACENCELAPSRFDARHRALPLTMFCARQAQPPPTRIPARLRNALGALLRGPAWSESKQDRPTCLFALGRLGDFVLTLSALRLLLAELGPAACTLVIPEPFAELAAREFSGARLLTLPTEAASLVREIVPIWRHERRKLAADRYERLVCFSHQRSLYYELALSWIDAAEDFRLSTKTYPQELAANGQCTELAGHLRLAETVLGRRVIQEEILPRFTTLFPTEDGRLLVCPLSRDSVRNLPPDTLLPALTEWWREQRAPVVFGGSPPDRPALEQLAVAARASGVSDVQVETPDGLDGLLAQVAGASAIFAADSAPAHIAAALDKPSVVMTSRSFFGYAQPWSRSTRQSIFVHGTPPGQIAAALPSLRSR